MRKKHENKEENELEEEQEVKTKERKPILKGNMKLYLSLGVILIAFVAGMLLSNYMKQGTIDQLNQNHKNVLETLQLEKEQLKADKETSVTLVSSEKGTLVAENEKLVLENANLETEITMFDGLLDSLTEESKEIQNEPYYSYKLTWQRYILAQPKDKLTTTVAIENTGSKEKKFNLEVRLRSSYKDALTTTPSDGSLTLEKGSSGNINLVFTPLKEGYAIYGLYINGRHEGDIVVFVRDR
ncbi:MAG: hypothetical protein KKG59_00135 [Nanoarchaeota archaeon]|nr:hypothetical protein [Nanoarchaeota archaeon]